jgi:exopolysaccharide production protein ExoQ
LITTANLGPSTTWEESQVRAGSRDRHVWTEVYAWMSLLPTLFITVGGWIQTGSGPVAFRFTAMEEDSLIRRVVRLGCSLLILFLLAGKLREIARVCLKTKMMLVLPVLALVSAAWSQNPTHTLVDGSNLLLTTLFAVYLYVRYPGRRLMQFLAFAAAMTLLLSIFLVLFVPNAGIDAFQQDAWRGAFGQRNNCAVVCTLFFVLGLQYRARDLQEHAMRGIVLVLSAVFIVMSGSRTGWVLTGLAVGLTLGVRLLAKARSLDRIALLMAAAVPAALLIGLFATNFNQILAVMDRDPTMTQRTVIWAEVFPSIAKSPWSGYGYSSFWAGLNGESMQTVLATGWMEGQAQDGYLDVLLELGVIGLVPLVWMFVGGFAKAAKALERRVAGPTVLLAIVLLPLILVANIGESSFLMPLGVPWFYALLAMLILNFARDQTEAF